MRRLLWWFVRTFLFLFDPELSHRFTFFLLRVARFPTGIPLRIVSGIRKGDWNAPVEAFDLPFLNPVGLAAGFDKDAEGLKAWPHLGFGFAEIGTVTPQAQPGNPPPRLFRDQSKRSLFNRMGFNSAGAEEVAKRIYDAKRLLPKDFRVGVNLGKNRDTPLGEAAMDYVLACRPFMGLADYLVINVSSPNTPGLKSLQTVQALRPIAASVSDEVQRWSRPVPLLLKLSPDLNRDDLTQIVEQGPSWGVRGWVLTNTLAGTYRDPDLPGGWSGTVLTEKSLEMLRIVRPMSRLPIISVGGIMSSEEARRRFEAGASLVQIYTGWVYRGPTLPSEINAVY